jgi:uncharacterized membrane protein YkvA (DUF1232 family)
MARTTNGLPGGAAAMAARGAAIAAYLKHVSPRRFRQLIGQVELAYECVRDVVRGDYRLPWRTVAALSTALAYFLVPIDLVPDFIPLAGFIDDAAVFGLVFGAAETDLRRYCDWRGLDPQGYFEAVASSYRKAHAARV